MIADLIFSDLFVAEDVENSWFKATPDSLVVHAVPMVCADELSAMRRLLDDHGGTSNFGINWPDKSGVRLRVERLPVANGKMIYVCRRFRLMPGPLAGLGVPARIANRLLEPELKEGLVLFFGKAGSGKSTTAASFIIERLVRHGGVCWTIENPIELPMQGRHGKGWCYQTEPLTDDGIGPAIKQLMRATPNIIMIGELRDGHAVKEAITAANSGHLVVATYHASDLLAGLSRMVRMAGDDNASSALSDALRVAMHLSLHNLDSAELTKDYSFIEPNAKGTGTPARILSVEPLWLSGPASDGMRSMLRDGDIHLLKSELERQRRGLLMGKDLP